MTNPSLRRADRPDGGTAFLAGIADPERPPLLFTTAVVVAHPDDETIGCGSLLPRLPDLTIIHVTDGAPRNGGDAERRGFASPEAYAAARRRELEAAVELAGILPDQLVSLAWPDQEASLHMAEIAADLARRLAGAEIVLTHAYEGGHPDHDAAALAVHAARRLIGRNRAPPEIIEMPLYRAGPDGWRIQSFPQGPDAVEILLELTPEERQKKDSMLAAHATQSDVLTFFSSEAERFRRSPDHDFSQLPNGGILHYERQAWGMTGARWLDLAGSALAELGLRPRR